MIAGKNTWIKVAYRIFALEGFRAVKIERVAKKVGVSKSSFYHYFADTDIFMEQLLQYHLSQAQILAEKEQKAQHIAPDLIDILIAHKLDLLFNRELRVHRSRPDFEAALQRSNAIVGNSFVPLWVRELNLKLSPAQLEGLFELALENFFLQISPERLQKEWLSAYFEHLKQLAGRFT